MRVFIVVEDSMIEDNKCLTYYYYLFNSCNVIIYMYQKKPTFMLSVVGIFYSILVQP